MTIGNIVLPDRPLFLAPMEDITDPSFRMVCKQYGADFMYTEFISSDGLIRNGDKSIRKLNIYEFERPIGIQLYGHLIDAMTEAAIIAEEKKPELIDINFGCPVKNSEQRCRRRNVAQYTLMIEMSSAIVKSVKLPVTVKTRLGWDDDNKNILEVTKRLQDAGIQAITIHGRTRAQLYKGSADWTLIGEVKNNPAIKIPVIGNGDIDSPVKAKDMFDRYGVDGIMIGRAAVGRPWIFRDIRHYLNTGELLSEPTVKEKADLALYHFNLSLEHKEGKSYLRNASPSFRIISKLPNFKETFVF